LSLLYKKIGRFQCAKKIWKESNEIYAFVELAKMYEHKENSLELAKKYTEYAIDLAEQIAADSHIIYESYYRLERIIRKMKNQNHYR
ncbi:MAG: hypothetical protein U9N34_02095, partial [Candidatus Cloacimonadota bacterium]|nr:hypothetical protein [Candidatus Cloacimonadota bacterium]